MSATDHTLTAPERENIEELLRLHVLADDEQIVYDLFETLLTQRGVTYEARLATAEAEKEALRASKSALVEKVKRLQDQIARANMEPGQDRQKAMHAYAARAEAVLGGNQ